MTLEDSKYLAFLEKIVTIGIKARDSGVLDNLSGDMITVDGRLRHANPVLQILYEADQQYVSTLVNSPEADQVRLETTGHK